jgi:hypothetical protein
LQKDISGSLFYQNKALQVWTQLEEVGFQLITLKHLTMLAPGHQEYKQMLQELQAHDSLKGLNLTLLFKDIEKKIAIA